VYSSQGLKAKISIIIIIIILFVSDTLVHSYIQKHTNTQGHTKTAKQPVKTEKNGREDW